MAAALPAELPGLLRYATSIVGDADVAEDLVGDTVVRALERAETFRGDSSLATWLHRILHNLAVDRMRRRREVPAGDLTAETSETVQVAAVEQRWHDDAYTVDAATVVARAEQAQELRDALIRLPYDHRAAVVLHDAEGLTARQIAEVFDIGLPAAKQRVRRGRMMLVSSLAAGAERREVLRGVPLSCWEARRHVSDYLDGEVSADLARRLELHLGGCPTCPALYQSLVAATGALQKSAGEKTGSTPSAALLERDPESTIPPALLRRLRAAGFTR